ncbi:MAG: GNAT family N-acetyltransferase [Ignavibacteriae bacterium]|nr:GNAT family N-acetyltransferase [Ignavibacteriota bacterium]
MQRSPTIINVTLQNVDKTGFFCYMSKRKSEGYARKLNWLKQRFDEGLRIKMLALPERGFIEYIPGEYAWRAVNARGYMFIHCLWVVGKSKGKGFSKLLLDTCIADAKAAGMNGVAMATSEGNWLAGKDLLLKNGFEKVDGTAAYELLIKKFRDAPKPSFVKDVDTRAKKFKSGFTVFRSDQCPYLEDATNTVRDVALESGEKFKVIEMQKSEDIRSLAPSVYGVFSIVYRGKLLAPHYLLKKDLIERMEAVRGA